LGVQGFELVPQQPLMLPDALKQKLGRRFLVLVENRDGAGAQPPLGIEAGRDRRHVAVAFAVWRSQSQALGTLFVGSIGDPWAKLRFGLHP